eukprot:CAMPEP_0178941950 /NCGR_PEP_ID=MMETSP0789-20121207/1708_1 /TAXON_ID=3005 /ORGANISM="Rhizosolenia setigera, Strain CCMP 1694" /LENGTH=416 /DNA_ID=CAMNT_0020621275 /DNA_START=68 /DNA_END=1318 /DNA_ORIENTATION=+
MKIYRVFPIFAFVLAAVSGLEQVDQNPSQIQVISKEKQNSKNIWTPNRKGNTKRKLDDFFDLINVVSPYLSVLCCENDTSTVFPSMGPSLNPTYSEKQVFAPSNVEADYNFGSVCSMSRDFLVVGAPGEIGDKVGSAHLFHLDGTEISELDDGGDASVGDKYGHGVAIDEKVVVGTYNNNFLKIFTQNGDLERTIHNDDVTWFGSVVKTLGDKILTKGSNDDGTGFAFLYSTSGERLKEFYEDGDYFHDVALSDELIALTSLHSLKTRIFFNSGDFTKTIEIDRGGTNVDISGDRVAIADHWLSDSAGAVWLYRTDDGFLVSNLAIPASASGNIQFGRRVQFIEEKLLVSAPLAYEFRGAVFIYDVENGNYEGEKSAPDGGKFGEGLCAGRESYYAVGADFANDLFGVVYLFRLSD